jgi:shikimate dehydrogenase
MITGHTKVAGVVGWPVEHSLSPAIHNAWFEHKATNWVYVAFPVESQHLGEAVIGLRALGVGGLSVTMPHKEAIIEHLDEVDDLAMALQAVNCVTLRDGRLLGTNTDGDGCCDAIENQGNVSLNGSDVALFGAGGTARAIAAAMVRRGARVRIVNRSTNRAHELVEMCGPFLQTHADASVNVAEVEDIGDCAVVVNATSVGMNTTEMPCDPSLLNPEAVVMDAVYSPLRTVWLEEVSRMGARTVDGLWMLIYQAMRQQQWWFGVLPDPLIMRAAAERELAHGRK